MESKQLKDFLEKNKLYADEIEMISMGGIEGAYITINGGDWYHEHIRCKKLMEAIGFKFTGYIETTSSGGDCFDAKHRYIAEGSYDLWERMSKLFAE